MVRREETSGTLFWTPPAHSRTITANPEGQDFLTNARMWTPSCLCGNQLIWSELWESEKKLNSNCASRTGLMLSRSAESLGFQLKLDFLICDGEPKGKKAKRWIEAKCSKSSQDTWQTRLFKNYMNVALQTGCQQASCEMSHRNRKTGLIAGSGLFYALKKCFYREPTDELNVHNILIYCFSSHRHLNINKPIKPKWFYNS